MTLVSALRLVGGSAWVPRRAKRLGMVNPPQGIAAQSSARRGVLIALQPYSADELRLLFSMSLFFQDHGLGVQSTRRVPASFLAAMPTWRHLDPLPVLSENKKHQLKPGEDEEDEEGEDA